MFIAQDWNDYELMDAGDGERLERWGHVVLRRPDPQVIWPITHENEIWQTASGRYHRSPSGGGHWEFQTPLPDRWSIKYRDLQFYIRPTNFKHTGLFPEQAANWAWVMQKIREANRPVKVLNLFAYTGGATVAAAAAGAEVCHVDAAKGMVQWARENLELSKLSNRPVRFITDDVIKFVQRELRRGNKYDAIIMDPPSYGRGPGGELWKLETNLYPFVALCTSILTHNPLFFIINCYTTGISPTVIENIMTMTVGQEHHGKIKSGEIALPMSAKQMVLPAGIVCRWESPD
jgi:23S rRNA (cytosine1962-C5)-methyltransferase